MPNWRCAAAKSLSVNENRAWDGGAAESAIWDWAGWDGNDPPNASGGKTRQAFLLYDADAPDQKGSYALPFCSVVDGKLVALASGLRAAASRLPQKDGVSDDESKAARAVLDGYFSKIHDDAESAKSDDERDAGILLARAPLVRASGVDLAKGYPDALLAHVYDRSALDEHPLFVSRATASTTKVDTFGTSMLPSTLNNFADDADGGLAIQNSHRTDELPLGRTWQGSYTGKGGNGVGRADMDFYIPLNLNLNGVDTNHVVDGIKTGIVRDVSVGFYGGEVRCSVCGKEMFTDLFSLMFMGSDSDRKPDPDAPCWHMPGLEYPSFDRKGEPDGESVVAVGQIDGAHCAELSLVFDGSTPGAQINGRRSVAVRKAEKMHEFGVLTRSTAHTLQSRYRGLRFPDLAARFGGVTLPTTPSRAVETGSDTSIQEGHEMPPEDETRSRAKMMPPSAKNPDPDGDGDDDTKPETDTDNSHWNKDGTKKAGKWDRAVADEAERAVVATDAATTLAVEAVAVATPVPAEPHVTAAAESNEDGDEDAAATDARRAEALGVADGQRTTAVLTSVRSAFIAAGLAPAEFANADSRAIAARVAEIGSELRDSRSSRDGFSKLRSRLVTQIRAEGVRAYGANGLPAAVYDPILESGSVDQLVGLLEFAEAEAGRRFKGGRATQDEPTSTTVTTTVGSHDKRNGGREIPASAFKAG